MGSACTRVRACIRRHAADAWDAVAGALVRNALCFGLGAAGAGPSEPTADAAPSVARSLGRLVGNVRQVCTTAFQESSLAVRNLRSWPQHWRPAACMHREQTRHMRGRRADTSSLRLQLAQAWLSGGAGVAAGSSECSAELAALMASSSDDDEVSSDDEDNADEDAGDNAGPGVIDLTQEGDPAPRGTKGRDTCATVTSCAPPTLLMPLLAAPCSACCCRTHGSRRQRGHTPAEPVCAVLVFCGLHPAGSEALSDPVHEENECRARWWDGRPVLSRGGCAMRSMRAALRRLEVALTGRWAGNLALVKLINQENLMHEWHDLHEDPNIDANHVAFMGRVLPLPPGVALATAG